MDSNTGIMEENARVVQYKGVVNAIIFLAGCHVTCGFVSMIVGIVSTVKAEVWLAHSVSPIWSGACFVVCGYMGIMCARRRTAYWILLFTALSVASLVTGLVSVQLLRVGLVNHTTDGKTFQKTSKDELIIVALSAAGAEGLACILSALMACQLARKAKTQLMRDRAEPFTIQLTGAKDFVIIQQSRDDGGGEDGAGAPGSGAGRKKKQTLTYSENLPE